MISARSKGLGVVHLAYCTIDPNVGDELPVNLIRQLEPSWATDHSVVVQIACNAASTFCPYFAVPDQFVNSDQDRKIDFYNILLQSGTGAVDQAPAGSQAQLVRVRDMGCVPVSLRRRTNPGMCVHPSAPTQQRRRLSANCPQIQEDTPHPHGYIRTIASPVGHSPPLITHIPL